jgi:glycosyltransferase involved in cell wall biosynthesis
LERCRSLAGRNISFLGYQPDAKVADLMGRARALVFAAEEDFGIVPVEAQASGTPVIAFGKGGIEDTVVPADGSNWEQATGVFFFEQTTDAIIGAVKQFIEWEKKFNVDVLRQRAELFTEKRFKEQICRYVSDKWERRCKRERVMK